MEKWIGAHCSAAGGVQNAVKNAKKIKARAFGLFTKNQRQWSAKPLEADKIDQFKKLCDEYGYDSSHILPHASYLINLGHPEDDKRNKSLNALIDEMQRCHQLGITMLNVHPGSHLGKIAASECLSRIAESVNRAIDQEPDVTVVLENTAGQGNSVGHSFEQLAEIIDQVENKNRVGACIDTCHAFAAGYDWTTKDGYASMIDEFDQTVGLQKLLGWHLNDSKKPMGSRVDRHDKIGEGLIGKKPFGFIIRDPRMDRIPLILETPNRKHWDKEIAMLYAMEDEKGKKHK